MNPSTEAQSKQPQPFLTLKDEQLSRLNSSYNQAGIKWLAIMRCSIAEKDSPRRIHRGDAKGAEGKTEK